MNRRTATALVLVPALVAGGLALPVLGSLPQEQLGADRPELQREPVPASVAAVPISGVDPTIIEESSVAMASWDTLVGDVVVGELGLADSANLTLTGDDAHDDLAHDIFDFGEEDDDALDDVPVRRSVTAPCLEVISSQS